jgi:hypothetical protein
VLPIQLTQRACITGCACGQTKPHCKDRNLPTILFPMCIQMHTHGFGPSCGSWEMWELRFLSTARVSSTNKSCVRCAAGAEHLCVPVIEMLEGRQSMGQGNRVPYVMMLQYVIKHFIHSYIALATAPRTVQYQYTRVKY